MYNNTVNKNVIAVIILTIIALIVLMMFSFGQLAVKKRIAETNPISVKPQGTEQGYNIYNNKEVKDNYYSIKLPKDWQVKNGQSAGSYAFIFPEGSGAVEIFDVPDNSTLELLILSQKEPLLKKSLTNYKQKAYRKLTVNGNEAYELTFDSSENGKSFTTVKTYIAGPDQAAVITLLMNPDRVAVLLTVISSITNSFIWGISK